MPSNYPGNYDTFQRQVNYHGATVENEPARLEADNINELQVAVEALERKVGKAVSPPADRQFLAGLGATGNTGYRPLDTEDVTDALGYAPAYGLRGSKTWDAPSVANNTFTSTTVTVTGAAMGDTVSVSVSVALPAGCVLAGAVTAAGVVTATLVNHTGAAVDLASCTLRADVWK